MLPLFKKIQREGPLLSKRYGASHLNKIKAKEYVPSVCHAKVAKCVKVFSNPLEFNGEDLNPNHLLKASRGSGFCLDLANKSTEYVRDMLVRWTVELQSRNYPVEFLIEEKLDDALYGKTGTAVDYKFFCFHGKPAYFLCRDGNNRNFYDLDYKPLKRESVKELDPIDLKPFLEVAEILSAPFPFVRIDLYNCKDGVYFGEYTFHCREGKQEFPMELEMELGKLWDLSKE